MGLGVSIFLIAVGAILTFAVSVTTDGLDINTVGVILMLVGALGFLASLLFWSSWGGFRRRETTITEQPLATRTTTYEERPGTTRTTTYERPA